MRWTANRDIKLRRTCRTTENQTQKRNPGEVENAFSTLLA